MASVESFISCSRVASEYRIEGGLVSVLTESVFHHHPSENPRQDESSMDPEHSIVYAMEVSILIRCLSYNFDFDLNRMVFIHPG